jgi:hypothetical protein
MRINHITPDPDGVLASTRYRILIPGGELVRDGIEVQIDDKPDPQAINVWHKSGGEQQIADIALHGGVFDITDGHFDTPGMADWYYNMCRTATVVTCSSPWLAEFVEEKTGVPAHYVCDPYEFPERAFEWRGGQSVMWFGSLPNFDTLRGVELDCPLEMITGAKEPVSQVNVRLTPYSRETMLDAFERHDVVIIPVKKIARKFVTNANRAVNALRQGKFVVAHDNPAHRELQDFIFIADRLLDGIQWARAHPDSVQAMVEAGQEYVRERFSPRCAADGWRQVFEGLH